MHRVIAALWAAAFIARLACAHQQPMSRVVLEIGSHYVAMNLHIPLNELELAFGHDVTQQPEKRIGIWGPPLRTYLHGHIRPATDAGQPWSVQVLDMTMGHAEQAQSGPFQEVLVNLSLLPPAGANPRNLVLNYDVIMHQVVTHKALVSVGSDWASGRIEPTEVGMIAVNTGTGRVEPVAIHLGEGSWLAGFERMVRLGMQHIREGLDHLLFLIVLLLPATLTVNGSTWGTFGGSRYSLLRVVRIVSAFTLGHSATLIAGALHVLKLPQQPVEVLIACSILVTAIHAIRPIFPGREAQIAAGFGLVHGLAFATVLADLKLAAGPLALSILGFNLGIELMQLFVIALTMPWLILLSQTPAHPWIRRSGALLAAAAAVGWIANRVSGVSNVVERSTATATDLAPLGILILAFAAIPAYIYTMLRMPAEGPQENKELYG
jgi:hypothetical protein